MNDVVEWSDRNHTEHRLQLVPVPKRIRVLFAGETVADSERAVLLRESGAPPEYYFPREDVRRDLLVSTGHKTECAHKGSACYWTIKADGRLSHNSVWSYANPRSGGPDLSGYMGFEWNSMDAWFEEDEQVYVHPRDPFTRVDVARSSRHLQVVVGGEVVADTRRPVMLFETGLPVRYYIPETDVQLRLMVPGDRLTRCPYKGEAHYYSVETAEGSYADIAWYYRYPTIEATGIAGMFAFYQERVGAFYLDGELQKNLRLSWA